MKAFFYKTKFYLALLLLLSIIFSVAHFDYTSVKLFSFSLHPSSSTETTQYSYYIKNSYNDLYLPTINKSRNLATLFASSRKEKFSNYKLTRNILSFHELTLLACYINNSLARCSNAFFHILLSCIIKYIHDQDGEKDSAFFIIEK